MRRSYCEPLESLAAPPTPSSRPTSTRRSFVGGGGGPAGLPLGPSHPTRSSSTSSMPPVFPLPISTTIRRAVAPMRNNSCSASIESLTGSATTTTTKTTTILGSSPPLSSSRPRRSSRSQVVPSGGSSAASTPLRSRSNSIGESVVSGYSSCYGSDIDEEEDSASHSVRSSSSRRSSFSSVTTGSYHTSPPLSISASNSSQASRSRSRRSSSSGSIPTPPDQEQDKMKKLLSMVNNMPQDQKDALAVAAMARGAARRLVTSS